MKITLRALLLWLTFGCTAQAAPMQFSGNGHWYEFIDGGYTWDQANNGAASRTYSGMQGYLATVTSADENAFLYSLSQNVAWLGGSDRETEGVWKWVTGPEAGQTFTYTNWSSGEPNNFLGEDYLQMNWDGASGSWNDHGAPGWLGQANGYFVEYSAPANNVPEPATVAIFALGLAGIAVRRRKK